MGILTTIQYRGILLLEQSNFHFYNQFDIAAPIQLGLHYQKTFDYEERTAGTYSLLFQILHNSKPHIYFQEEAWVFNLL